MSKKLLSLVGSLLLIPIAVGGQSFAVECGQPESQVASGEESKQSGEMSKLINDTVDLAKKVIYKSPRVIMEKNGSVCLLGEIFPCAGAKKAQVGQNFKVDEEELKKWIKSDIVIKLDYMQNCWMLNKEEKKMVKNISKLKQNGVYDQFINAYVDFIFDDELKIAEGKIAEVRKLLRRGDSLITRLLLK